MKQSTNAIALLEQFSEASDSPLIPALCSKLQVALGPQESLVTVDCNRPNLKSLIQILIMIVAGICLCWKFCGYALVEPATLMIFVVGVLFGAVTLLVSYFDRKLWAVTDSRLIRVSKTGVKSWTWDLISGAHVDKSGLVIHFKKFGEEDLLVMDLRNASELSLNITKGIADSVTKP